jgi:gamma-glutamylputrescine oxidase
MGSNRLISSLDEDHEGDRMGRARWVAAGAIGALSTLPLFVANNIARKPAPVIEEPERLPAYWMGTIPELPRFRPLDENITVDVAVVGGGFTGLAIGYYLKQLDPSLRVAVLEAQRFGSGASSRNSGGAPDYFRGHGETAEAKRGYNQLRLFCIDNGLDVELEEKAPMVTLHRHRETATDPFLTGDALRAELNSPYYDAAVAGMSNRLHPGKLIAGLIEANHQAGVELYEYSPVVRVQPGKPVWLHTESNRVIAGQVALATNAYSPGMGFATDRMFALHHRVIVTRPLTDAEWEASRLEQFPYRLEHGTFFTHTARRTADRRLFFRHLLGHRAFERTDWTFTADDIAYGQEALLRRYPWADGIPIDYEWHGVTARTRDRWPVAGPIDEGISIAAGFNGNGVMATHYFGHLLAQQMLGRDHQDMGLLSPAEAHPAVPPELTRSIGMSAWLAWERRRDG